MVDLSAFFAVPPFAWGHDEKAVHMLKALGELQAHHTEACPAYRKICRLLGGEALPRTTEEYPFFPVRLFKMYALKSIGPEQALTTMTSSGTTGQAVSKIFLDRDTAAAQSRTLAHIVRNFTGNRRLPMVIIDSRAALKDPKTFSARGAGILGFSNFGFDHFYALDEHMDLDVEGLLAHVGKHRAEPIFFFGFTFMIWRHFCETLQRRSVALNLDNALVIHGGGWKKMSEQAVGNEVFRDCLRKVCGPNTRVHNFYGMVEQTGSVYMECECGCLHASNFSQIVIRDPVSFEPLPAGRQGLVETISVLPWSYPGQALLTEDLGELLGEDDCRCKRKGRYFVIHGRVPKSETRGCSDTYALG